jgi:hypothetical protein
LGSLGSFDGVFVGLVAWALSGNSFGIAVEGVVADAV